MSRGSEKYWVRLDSSRFENGGDIDYLLSQKGGSEYVSLYIKLCLVTRNTNGMLATEFGKDIIIPYDIDKIVRECKYFSRNTVLVAMEAYKKLGLIYTNQDGNLVIADYEDIMRKESSSAERVRALRKKQREALHCNAHCNKSVTPDVTQKDAENVTGLLQDVLHCNEKPAQEGEKELKGDESGGSNHNKALQCNAHCNKSVTPDVTQKDAENVTGLLQDVLHCNEKPAQEGEKELKGDESGGSNHNKALQCNAHCNKSVTPDVTQKEESTDGSFPPPFINNNKSPLSSSFTREEKETPSKIGACEETPAKGPSLDEVKAYFEGNMLKGSPEIFFFHHESIGWRDPQGRAITNWRARAKKWHYDEAKYYPQGNSGDVNTGMQKDLKKGVSDL